MKVSRRNSQTSQVELVETYNLTLSLRRIYATSNGGRAWKRAIYHALDMAGVTGHQELQKIRDTLQLP